LSAKIVEFVSFTGAFTSQYEGEKIKETCESVDSIRKETCQKVTQFDEPYKTACFWGVNKTSKDGPVYDPGLCTFLWSTSMSFPRVNCNAARGLQSPKETCKIWTGRKSIGDHSFTRR